MKILIADDDPTTLMTLAETLKQMSHEVTVANNGLEAWALLQEPDSPRLVILDWMMPQMSGIEVCNKIRSMVVPYRYVIMHTSKSNHWEIDAGYSGGVDDYLIKPINAEILYNKLHVAKRILAYEEKMCKYATEMESLAKDRAQQLIHADRMATLGMLSAGVAHEINNPLTFIAGNTQTLERAWNQVADTLQTQSQQQGQEDRWEFILDEVPKMLVGIHNGVNRISKIVSGLKRFARQDKIVKQSCSVVPIINESLEFCHSKLHVNIAVSSLVDPDLPKIFCDLQQIEQVLINLIMNAADAMKSTPKGRLTIHAMQVDAMICIAVQDNGPGLPSKLLNRLINPFYTTKAEGTGLGLSISSGIIEEHGGRLTAHNNSGVGACFEFTLPIETNISAP